MGGRPPRAAGGLPNRAIVPAPSAPTGSLTSNRGRHACRPRNGFHVGPPRQLPRALIQLETSNRNIAPTILASGIASTIILWSTALDRLREDSTMSAVVPCDHRYPLGHPPLAAWPHRSAHPGRVRRRLDVAGGGVDRNSGRRARLVRTVIVVTMLADPGAPVVNILTAMRSSVWGRYGAGAKPTLCSAWPRP